MLILKDFGISFADRNLLEGINIEIPEGTVFHLKGPNASGKSSLLNAISGIIPEYVQAKTTGDLIWNNIDLQTIPLKEKHHYLWHQLSDTEAQIFFPDCISELAFALENMAIPSEKIWERVNLATQQFGLSNLLYRDPSTLSGGEKKLLLCAIAETIDPPILLLDEPLNGLDNRAVKLVLKWISDKKEQGKIIVVVDHNPIIETLADFSFILADNPQLPKTDIAFISNNYLNIADNLGYQINPNTDILYRVEELNFAYPQSKPLFTKLTVEIGSKQNILLTGNNGAGKSSFLKLLAGLIKPLKGKIYLGGKLMQGLDTKNFEYIYYQSQITKENLLGISVAQNWLFWQLAIKQLPDLPLKDDPLFTELSAGQQKMVSQQILPQLLSKFWILDEPFASLDKDAGTKLLQLLQYKSKKHPGMLIVSHSLEEHNDMFDRVLTIRNHFLQEETK